MQVLETDGEAAVPPRPRVLVVDDERAVVDGLRRVLSSEYDVTVATSGADALAAIAEGPPFDVIVSDMRMPVMDGATFLGLARQQSPDSARILLTGQTDITSAMAAVNNGAIFRFLGKPCDVVELRSSLRAGVRQVELVRAERELLDTTLTGSVQLLTDVLEMAAPATFARSRRITRIARHLGDKLVAPTDVWMFELAARLSQIGVVSLPHELVSKVALRVKLTSEEQAAWERHPETAARLIASIPRLKCVAAIVRRQLESHRVVAFDDVTAIGAATLALAIVLDGWLAAGDDLPTALRRLVHQHERRLLEALTDFDRSEGVRIDNVSIAGLRPEMVLDEDLRMSSGTLILSAGTELTAVRLERISAFHTSGGCHEPVRVRIPG